ncbi:MAG: YcaO-like family protein [Stappiaceae bacterium]
MDPSLKGIAQLFDFDEQRYRKNFLNGCQRLTTPAQTLENVRPLMARMGITRIANITGLDRLGIPVVMVCRPNARSIAVSLGKGLTMDSAKASGLMESVEIYHAEHIELPLKLLSKRLASHSHNVIDTSRLVSIADSPFHDDTPIMWIEGWDLMGRCSCWLPYETVHANYTAPKAPGHGCFDSSTNGLASGNSLIEAICHGICEVIERDALAVWNHRTKTERSQTSISLKTINDTDCLNLLRQMAEQGFSVQLFDITSDIAVPTIYCVLRDDRNPNNHIGIGSGTHPSREIATIRALTEAAQVRTTYISGARDDLTIEEFDDQGRRTKRDHADRLVDVSQSTRHFQDVPTSDHDNFLADLTWLLDRLAQGGIEEVVAVNLSQEELDVAVARVVIPGLEGPDDHGAFVPGTRLRSLQEAAQ